MIALGVTLQFQKNICVDLRSSAVPSIDPRASVKEKT